MRALKVFYLDVKGAPYVRARLTELCEWGGPEKALSMAVAEAIETVAGRIWTMAPPETSSERLCEFESGGLLTENLDMSRAVDVGGGKMMAIESLRDEERKLFETLLREQPGRGGLFADPIPKRGDPCVSHFASTALYAGEKIFHFVDAASDDETIALAFGAAPFWTSMWMVTSAPPKLRAERDISEEELRASAAAAIAVSFGAYDGEGFVVWQREM